jgi:hypothetical protein
MTNTQQSFELSAPAQSGFRMRFDNLDALRAKAAELLEIPLDEMYEQESCDGATTYCYTSETDAARDSDGAYSVQYYALREEDDTDIEVAS